MDIIICDDIERHIFSLKKSIENVIENCGLDGRIVLWTQNPDDVISYAKSVTGTKIYFLDINLENEKSGIDVAKEIRKTDNLSYIIYTTAHQEYAIEGYKTKTFDYLTKPIDPSRIRECLSAVFHDYNQLSLAESKVFALKCGSVTHKIKVDDIIYIRKEKTLLDVYIEAQAGTKRLSGYMSLKEAEEMLDEDFIMVFRNCIVSKKHIQSVDKATGEIVMSNGHICWLSRYYKNRI